MDVADRIVILANGRVEQAGSPDEVYENPASPFVMSFLGAVTHLDGQMIRPHDVLVSAVETPGSVAARVTRVARLGFEVRVEMLDKASGDEVWTQMTRERADELALTPDMIVYLTARPDAVRIPNERSGPSLP